MMALGSKIGPEMKEGLLEEMTRYLLGPECGFQHCLNLGKSSDWGRDLVLYWRDG